MAGAKKRPPAKGRTTARKTPQPAKGRRERQPHILHAPVMRPQTREDVFNRYIDEAGTPTARREFKPPNPGLSDPRAWWQKNRVALTPFVGAAGMLAGSMILFKEHAPAWAPLAGAAANGWTFLPVWGPHLARLGARAAELGDRAAKVGEYAVKLSEAMLKRGPKWTRDKVHKYARALTASGALWCTLTAWHGVDRKMFLWLFAGTLAFGTPWWNHHRVRPLTAEQAETKATEEAWETRWEGIRNRLTLQASRVIEVTNLTPEDLADDATGISVELLIQLVPGVQEAAKVKGMSGAIESALRLPPGSVRIETVKADASQVTIRIVTIAAGIVTWEAVAKLAPASLAGGGKFVLGLSENGTWKSVNPRGHWMVIGGTRSGKSTWLHALLAQITGCPDAVVLGIDLKGGAVLRRWDGALHRVAITRPQAERMLTAVNKMIDERATFDGVSEGDGDQLDPGPDCPAAFIVFDECAEGLGSKEKANRRLTELTESIARRGAAMGIYLVLVSQDGSLYSFGTEALRGQLSRRLCFRVQKRNNAQYVLSGYGRLPVTELEPGQFLYSDGTDDETPCRGPHMTPDDNTQLPQQIAAANAPKMARLDARTAAAGGKLLADLPRTVAEATGQTAGPRDTPPMSETPAPPAGQIEQAPLQEDDDTMTEARNRAAAMQRQVEALFEGFDEIPTQMVPVTREQIDAELDSAETRMARGLTFDDAGITRKALVELVGMSPAWTDQRLKALANANLVTQPARGKYHAGSADEVREALKRYDPRSRELASA